MGANIRIFSMRSARFWGNFKVWGQNIHPWSVPNLAGLGREVGPGRGQEVLALPDAQVSSLGSCIHKIYSEYLDCIFLETHDLIINYCHRNYVSNKVPTKFSAFFLQSISLFN